MGDYETRPSSESDEEIKYFLAQDSYSHFSLVIKRYRVQLVQYAAKRVGMAAAEDVIQIALTNACESLRGFSQERILNMNLRSWLFTIVTNECNRVLRKKTLQTTTIDPDEDGSLTWLMASDKEQPEEALEIAEMHDAILAAIDKLPPLYRPVIFLRYIEDMKGVDIAAQLQKDLNAIKAQIKRGTALLRVLVLHELEVRGDNQRSARLKEWLSIESERKQKEEER